MTLAPGPESAWEITLVGYDDEHQRVHNALFALAAGGLGTSGGPLLVRATADRWIVCAGVYDGDGPETRLLTGPVLTGLAVADADECFHRRLDLRAGVLHERIDGTRPTEMLRFVSLARPGIVAVRTAFPDAVNRGTAQLSAVADGKVDEGETEGAVWMRVTGSEGGIVAAVCETRRENVVDDFAAVVGDSHARPEPDTALTMLSDAARAGFDVLRDEHEHAWSARWEAANVVIDGDDHLQLATRFALFHLMASTADIGEAAVGARGVSGTGYRGHVFWDADTFVLPFLAATHPASARAMLEYRLRRLPTAVEAARDLRRAGARFPWESARSGRDVTPHAARDRTGRLVPIRTGQLEEHVVAQVAWAACHYVDWTGDATFADGPGLTLLVETARYWASRVRTEGDGSVHIYGVIGPDEYHEPVDDSAFTNVIARWNLRHAADAVDAAERRGVAVAAEPSERHRWRAIAEGLVDGFDPATGIYEEFAGFHALEPLIIADVAPRRPIAADLLLGADRVANAQVIKQADVLMMHHLIPDEVAPGSLAPNLRHYEPRTAHGSSLSPAVHAALLARTRDYARALHALHITSRVDLDDMTGTTAEGLHVGTMGGLWQALVYGFAGVRPRAGRLRVDPRLPPDWGALEVNVQYRGVPVVVRLTHDQLSVRAAAPVDVEIGDATLTVGRGTSDFRAAESGWELVS